MIKKINNKIIFVSIIFTLVTLYTINNIVDNDFFIKNISLPIYTVIPGILVILSILALSKADKIQEIPKKSLLFLTISFSLWFAAEQTWNLYEHVLEIDPYPSIADLFYISAPIFMVISILLFLHPLQNKIKKTTIIIASVISIALLIPIMVLTYQANSDTEFIEIVIAEIYPIVDTVLLIPVIIAISISLKNIKNSFWIMLMIGIVIFIAADHIFLILIVYDGYYEGNPVDILWLTSYVVWIFAMNNLIQKSKENKQTKAINSYEKLQAGKINRHGINIILLLIISTTIIILIALNYFWILDTDTNFMLFFSLVLITTMTIFSAMIAMLNSKLTKANEMKSIKINELSNELIKKERLSAIGELAARLSHDLRNPLSVIKSSIELITLRNADKLSTSDKEAIQRVDNAISRMTNQIKDVLNYVKQTPVEKKEISITSCIKSSIDEIQIPTKIDIRLPENHTQVFADEIKLEIVFSNLLRNAIDAIGNN
ncbi:MAG: sensor histidine kinase, partial [Nitrosarchaeum sp.]